ncbi:STM4015 family protein [Streptomyces drozdowiczii]|uniref:STM4015 family protein n=1 Tax=Streptomyces drozdowiczii TaxID=202862 RepID=A0ABY6PM78_9ACTN|nr:STM4015 family protein [Streptomyces drozdowiczii]MCX0247311.1 STM4015 family protein [Streptomyces drozdowiczii]UZK53278.1 STM4015 family protein [Streptomyces drozdowiczii]
MTGIDHPCSFHDLPVFTLPEPGDDRPWPATLPTPDAIAWRLESTWEGPEFAAVWRHFLTAVDPAQVRALVIGPWWQDDYSSLAPVVELITSDAARFPALRALFLADVVGEECEVSWLQMCDITPVLRAFPRLEELVVRGGGSGLNEETLELHPVRHEALKALRFESGGLPGHVVRAVGACELPALERLEVWLGSQWYAGDATVADMAPLLSGGNFPRLRHLGLQNSEIQDEIAVAVASAPVVAQLESLSLSMGTLSDAGGLALLEGQPLTHLDSLDLHHHYLSDEVMDRFKELSERDDVHVHLGEADDWDPDDEDDSRYVAVSE